MSDLYLIFLILAILYSLSKVMMRSERIFEYPYFMAAVFAVFILPQAFSLVRFHGRVSSAAVDDVLLMTCLCFFSAVIGYQLKPSAFLFRIVSRPVIESRMLHIGILFTACGYFFGYLLSQIKIEMHEEHGGMTGIGTIYLFFASLKFPGFAICLSLFFQQLTLSRFFLALLAGVSPLGEVILGGRREPAVVVGLIFFLGLYYYRSIKPPASVIFGALLLAMLAIPATGNYRDLVSRGDFDKITRMDLVGNFKDYFGKESILELRNAAATIQMLKKYGDYEYGAGYWNQLVFRFVPAQLIGKDKKNSIMIGSTVDDMFRKGTSFGYEFSTGSTLTGMGDSFRQFGWFGCLFFAFLAVIFRSFWIAALQPNALFAQLLYLLICTSAMRAVTHQTVDFLPGFVYQLIFLALGLWYAGDRGGHSPGTNQNSQVPSVARGRF